jgi:NAD(P)-dependent dehydrogenase (short-subunit alcohol dehydrogenase family)
MQNEPQTRETIEFNGKRILVTGGTKGIGEATVNRLVRGGATVITTARSIPAGSTPERFVQADVSTREGVDPLLGGLVGSEG